jgi:hypothetical protein
MEKFWPCKGSTLVVEFLCIFHSSNKLVRISKDEILDLFSLGEKIKVEQSGTWSFKDIAGLFFKRGFVLLNKGFTSRNIIVILDNVFHDVFCVPDGLNIGLFVKQEVKCCVVIEFFLFLESKQQMEVESTVFVGFLCDKG